MILYYALGGGLGHISRSFALISHAPKPLQPRIRLLISSKSAYVARPHSPCPVDEVPRWAMAGKGRYPQFLADHFKQHGFSCIVIDTFPFGLLGELKHAAPELPRVLVGRYLRWGAYIDRCGETDDAVWPQVAVMIEQQQDEYLEQMERNGRVINAPWPISLARLADAEGPAEKPACCVVHSGTPSETRRLMSAARNIMSGHRMAGPPELFTPEKGLFPLERHMLRFSDIVTGAGYGSCAAASVLNGRIRYHLHPFPRRFDDQTLRLRRLQEGKWGNGLSGDASTVAEILWNNVTAFLK